MYYISIFTLQQLLLRLHLLVIAELSSLCHSSVLLTHCIQVFTLHIVDPPFPLSLGCVSSERVVSHTMAVFHTLLGAALISATTSQSCLPS